jgi:aminopeptidase N
MKNSTSVFKKSYFLLFYFLFFALQSCYYKPFLTYRFNKEGFKHFSKTEKRAGDNSNPMRAYKVNRYDWAVEVFPDKKRIAGSMDIYFTPEMDQKSFMFDLQKKMKIQSFKCSAGKVKLKRQKDVLIFEFNEPISANKRVKLTIHYKGKPANVAKQGPIQWKKDEKGRPWISTLTEGIGPQFIMPCNALLGNEADSVSITVTVPRELSVAANGQLSETRLNPENGTKTFRHEVTNPINIYNISFNIGHFVEITKPYTDINGVVREIKFEVLDFNKEKADTFYNQVPIALKAYEELFGEYPFWADGCKFIESTFDAMEHQSGIAMGNDYRLNYKDINLTLVHELAHEWWGNSVSGADYSDIWLHEGMATYSEALLLEKMYGVESYNKRIRNNVYSIYNTIPILKKEGVLYNSWVQDRDSDIYGKGALMMHSLRKVVNNDDLFLGSLKTLQKEFSKQNITSQQFISRMNELLGKDYSELFDWYLKREQPPVLQIILDRPNKIMKYKWQEKVSFFPEGEIQLEFNKELINLTPSTEYQVLNIDEKNLVLFVMEYSIYYYIELDKKAK